MTEYRPHAHALPSAHTEHAAFPPMTAVDLMATAATVRAAYRNDVMLDINDHCLRLAVLDGASRWHVHPRSDECFLVMDGTLLVDLADGREARLCTGAAYTVPAGVVHRTRTVGRTVMLCFEHRTAYTDVTFRTPEGADD